MNTEKQIYQKIRIQSVKHKCILFPNPNGNAYTGKPTTVSPAEITLQNYRRIKFGLIKGASDLIGLTEKVITKDMVGSTVAIFTAIEVKKEGWTVPKNNKHYEEQKNFIDQVVSRGGIAGFSSSVEEFENIMGKL